MIKQVLEQSLHALWGFGIVALCWLALGLPAAPWWALVACFFAAVVSLLPRELVDQWPIEDPIDTLVDSLFYGLGGVLAGLMAWRLGL